MHVRTCGRMTYVCVWVIVCCVLVPGASINFNVQVCSEYAEGRLEVMTEPRCVGMTELFSGRANQETVRARGLVQAYKLTKGYAHFIVVDFRPLVHVCMRACVHV